jgi:hypothetical protein
MPQLLTVQDLISETELVEKACSTFELTAKRDHHDRWATTNVGEYKLNPNLIEALKPAGFTFEQGQDSRSDLVYLAGHSHQTNREMFLSDTWVWDKSEKIPT